MPLRTPASIKTIGDPGKLEEQLLGWHFFLHTKAPAEGGMTRGIRVGYHTFHSIALTASATRLVDQRSASVWASSMGFCLHTMPVIALFTCGHNQMPFT